MQRFQGKFVKGSEPPSVYWQRRAIVAAAVLVLALVVVIAFKALASDDGDTTDEGEAEPQEWVAPSASDTLNRPYVSEAPSDEPGSASSSPAVPECDDGDLMLQVVAAFDEVRTGSAVPVSVLVASTAAEPCTADLDAVAVELAAGSDVVYSTAHCEESEPGEVELSEGEGQTVEFELDGLASEPGCTGDRRQLPEGDYEITAKLGEAASQPSALALT